MKKTLSIILAIIMVFSVCPVAFAADEVPDFSDAKVLTGVDGILYVNGVEADSHINIFDQKRYVLPTGKYKITENITTDFTIWVDDEQNVELDLNGYTWDLGSKHITINGTLSVYDTSSAQTGKMVSTVSTILTNNQASVFNLYSGTLESTGRIAVSSNWGETYLYGGTVKGATHAVHISNVKVKLCGTVLESGEGYPTLSFSFPTNATAENANPIDVSEYTGESLSVAVSSYETTGDIPIIKGIKNAQDAERYTIESVTISEAYVKDYGLFHKETVYNEETGEISVVIDTFAITQQPSNDNNYTVDTNNAKATYQWYETVVENSTASVSERHGETILTGDFKAGDSVTISTEDDIKFVDIMTIPAGDMLYIDRHQKSVK